jgi:hypothetical protein
MPSEEDLVNAHLDEGSKEAEVSQPTRRGWIHGGCQDQVQGRQQQWGCLNMGGGLMGGVKTIFRGGSNRGGV